MDKKQRSAYLRFLDLCHALERKEQLGVDATAIQLLKLIGVSEFNEKPKTVTEMMALSTVASPATIHRKLDELINEGLAEKRFTSPDHRTKRLFLTPKGQKFFVSRDKLLAKVMRSA